MAVVSSCQVGNCGRTTRNRCVFRGWIISAKAVIAIVVLCRSAFGATLVWDPNAETDVAGYRVYSGTASRQYSSVVDVGNTTQYRLTNVVQGTTYFFALTAYSTAGLESVLSAEVSYAPPASNTSPAISSFGPRTIDEDTSTGPIPFTISDAETPGSLVLSATSSNPSLVPAANMTIGGSGTNRTLMITPPPNQSGSATITVSVSDGEFTASNSFVLTVNAVNDTPTIANIADRTIDQNTATGPIGFVIGDIETAAASLVLSAGSSNPSLVPIQNIVFGGSGGNRTVNVTPVTNQTGTATINITVSDGARTATDSWVLTVRAVSTTNTPPAISTFSPRTVDEDTSLGPIAFAVGDAETPNSLVLSASSSNPALVPTANMTIGGTSTNRTLMVTPALNQSGSATITVSVSDGQFNASSSFMLTVNPVNDTPTIANINDLTIDQNTATGPIGFVVGDIETAASSLTLSAGSSNPTLVPIQNVVFGGSGSNRTVNVTPAANQTGTAIIKITVSDGVHAASDSWVLTVRSTSTTNTPPVLSSVRSTTIFSDGSSLPIRFSVSDAETPTETLQVWAVSSNPALIPENNILFEGSGSTRTLTVTANSGIGNVTITLNVSDGSGNTQSTNFGVSVVSRPTQLVYLPFEAEEGSIVSPMRTYSKSGVTYVAATSHNQGSVSFQFSITQPGNYIIWARHLSPNNARDSFNVSVDGVEISYATAIGTWSSDWQWTRVTAPGSGGTQDPRVLSLSAGTHTVTFRGAEANCGLDRIIICNDLEFAPGATTQLAATTADAEEVSATAEISAVQDVEVIWESTPGLIYKVQGKRDLLDSWKDVSGPIVAADFESSWIAPARPESFQFYRVVLVE